MKSAITVIFASLFSLSAFAQNTVDFESPAGYKGLSVYDTWEKSPFRDGRLQPNVSVVDNPDKRDNNSAKVLGAQRSRYGSNTFGVRVDLAKPFELTPQTKYVHVLLNRPVEGRVMLVGLGHFCDFPDRGQFVEQFWELSTTDIPAGRWGDAVFAVKGSGDIDINSLVVVPQCESPHNLDSDFLFYIDDILVDNSPLPRIANEDYPLDAMSKNATTISVYSPRRTSAVSLNGQSFAFDQNKDGLLYHFDARKHFNARAGETLHPGAKTRGKGLQGAVWLDLNNDGRFDEADLMATTAAPGDSVVIPSFTLPADMKPGMYRLRYVIDTKDPVAGGRPGKDGTASAGGSVTDVLLNVHPDVITVNDHQLNGEVLAADGRKLNSLRVPSGKPFTIRMNPEKGFTHGGFTITRGYFATDSVIHGNPQRISLTIPAFEGDTYTIPAEWMDADILINGRMVERGSK